MTIHIRPELWKPRGIADLEPNAWEALRHPGSACVVAGPGAGKTEFLAQRAVYLLETGTCPDPYRILAISFKTDAAANLARRVRQRCSADLSHRFSSMTFDAFTKGLVDRFLSSVPPGWRPSQRYEVAFPKRGDVESSLDSARSAARSEWRDEIAALSPNTFEARQVGRYRLPPKRSEPTTAVEFAIHRWWDDLLKKGVASGLSFIAINRLAEVLLRANARLLRALRATYRYVFVDEFQDTTYAQYDFLLSAFRHEGVVTTGVGDDKQRIMGWAGARTDAFDRFVSDFSAHRIELRFNFRSSPDLVRIQHVVAQALDPNTPPPVSKAPPAIRGDVAQVWKAADQSAEARHLASWIASDMATRGTAPRDYAILVRQKADDFETALTPALSAKALAIRNESRTLGRTTLQDLLADDLSRSAQALLRLGSQRRAPVSWQLVSSFLEVVRAIDPDDPSECARVDEELSLFMSALRAELVTAPSVQLARQASSRVFSFLDLEQVARAFPEYRTGNMLEIIVEAFALHLEACAQKTASWQECVDLFEGTQSIPLMTVHKSKGLEYDTILFVGLDDQAWWSYRAGDKEGLATFFVALSRAKQRAIFTFCGARGQRRNVAELYQLLTTAGVPEVLI
jgi:superfamily I DNA/RNA helicase